MSKRIKLTDYFDQYTNSGSDIYQSLIRVDLTQIRLSTSFTPMFNINRAISDYSRKILRNE